MTAVNPQGILQHIRRLAGPEEAGPSDGDLLRRYLTSRDESAFAALVGRHAAMVVAVCRSVLRRRDDAEDASQAAFLILARKAGSIRRPDALSSWLHGVAYRVALKARASAARRREREAAVPLPEDNASAADELTWGEVRAVLHAELEALPERFRAPLVLCYLEGLTQEEAARRLGWTPTTVKGRVQRGRDKLRRRLERRGLTLAAALGAALTGQALAETAVRAARPFTVDTATRTAVLLARSVLRPILPARVVVLSALLLSTGVVAAGLRMPSAPPADEKPAPPVDGANVEGPAVRQHVDLHGDPLPPGAVARLGTVRFNHGDGLHSLSFTPDGKTILSEGAGGIRFWDVRNGKEIDHILTDKTFFDNQAVFLADGRRLITLKDGFNESIARTWSLLDKKETSTKRLKVRRNGASIYHVNALSPDGKLCALHVDNPAQVRVFDLESGADLYQLAKGDKPFLAVTFAGSDRLVTADEKQRIEVWEARTGKRVRAFTHDTPVRFLLASPDGRWLATLPKRPSPHGRPVDQPEVLQLWDLTSGTRMQSFPTKPEHWFCNVCFYPDSERVLTSTRKPGHTEVTIWERRTGRQLQTFDNAAGADGEIAAFSPDGAVLAEASRAGKFELWDVKTGRRLSPEDSRYSQAAAVILMPTAERATLIGRGCLSSWDGKTGRRLRSFDLPREDFSRYARGHSPDGRYVVTFRGDGDSFQMLVWDVRAEEVKHMLRAPGQIHSVTTAFSRDSSMLATLHPDKQTLVRLWDVRTGEPIRSFPESKAAWPWKMLFSADGKTLYVAGKYIVAYEVATGKEVFSWRMKPLPNNSGVKMTSTGGPPADPDDRVAWRGLALAPDESVFAAILYGGRGTQREGDRLALYEARTGRIFRRWNDSGLPSRSYEQLVFSHDGQVLASSDGMTIHLWEAATSRKITTFTGHRGDVYGLSFSGDDRRLASASGDSTVLIWDATGDAALDTPEQAWDDLAAEDAGRAHRAVWALVRSPDKAVTLLRGRVHPVESVRRETIEQWIKDLDADEFAVREKAAAALEKRDDLVVPALRRALEARPTLEQRRRIEPMLHKLEAAIPAGEALRSLRALRVLEHVDTPEARRLLQELASGAEDARLTRQARQALLRQRR